MTKDEAIHKALKVLNCLNNDRVYETAWVKGAINACEEALEQPAQEPLTRAQQVIRANNSAQPLTRDWKDTIDECIARDSEFKEALEQPAEPRLVSYALDGSTCTLNIDGEEVYFNREQPAQEPVAWMHYKDFTIVMHDVWEELLDGKDDWYPLYMEQSQSNKLQQVVIEHIKDLRKCAPALRMYKEMNQTADEVEKAANELEQALRSKNEQ